MNTNNKEALRLLESMRDFELDECNYLKLKKAMSLLEDNEDAEDYDEDEVSILVNPMGDYVMLNAPSLPVKLSYKKFIELLSTSGTLVDDLIEKKDTEVQDIAVKDEPQLKAVRTDYYNTEPVIIWRCTCGREHTVDAVNHKVYKTETKPSSKVEKPDTERQLFILRNKLRNVEVVERYHLVQLIDILILAQPIEDEE